MGKMRGKNKEWTAADRMRTMYVLHRLFYPVFLLL
jgi:hypothetical protein